MSVALKFLKSSDTNLLICVFKIFIFGFYIFLQRTIINVENDILFLARDIAGEKPLYYKETNDGLEFASEAKSLGVCNELEPAHYLWYEFKNKQLIIRRWWEFKPIKINLDTVVEDLESLLEDSIRLRTRSDVPYGLYLSGGMDSTIISTFHKFEHNFTYTEGDYEEEFKKVFPKIVWHLDYPVRHFSAFALWKLAEMAKENGVKVVMGGEGADELFGGYIRYMPDALYEQAQKQFPSYKSMFPFKKTLQERTLEEFNGNMREELRMRDRMSSAFGVEHRTPFFDRRIIEFAFSLPLEWRVRGFETKYILRKILEKRKPDYKHIEKAGLYCPVNKWIGSKQIYEKDDYLVYQKQCLKK